MNKKKLRIGVIGFGNGKIATIPTVGIVMLVMTALFVYLSGWTKYGKKIYAIGSNFKVARCWASCSAPCPTPLSTRSSSP